MEYRCNRCGALKFNSASALSNHQRNIVFFSSQRNMKHTCKWVNNTNPQAFELAQGLQQENLQQEDQFDFDNLVSILDDPNPPPYDCTFSHVHWIKHCRATIGLSSKDINSLFEKVLFHPSFKLEDVNVRSIAQINHYEQFLKQKMVGINISSMLHKVILETVSCTTRTHQKHYLLCFHHLVSKKTFKLHQAMVFTKVFILPQIQACRGYKCKCQFQFYLSSYKHFGNLWNVEPHKHTMSRGYSSSFNFLQ